MIEPASLIGFALAFLVASWAGSVLLGSGVLLAGRWLRAAGPGAERRAASSAIALPPVASGVIVLVLAGYSVGGPRFGLADHCPEHLHHLHLCLFHGASWAHQVWAVTTVAFISTIVFTRVIHRAGALFNARVALQRVAKVSQRLASPAGEVFLAPATIPFCFVAGLFEPRIFVSTAAWERLDEAERAAMLAHERAHAEQGDLWRRSVIDGLALFAAPLFATALVERWSHATERLCDHRAALVVGEPEPVARALLSLARAGLGRPPVASACFLPAGGEVVDRVEALLAGEGDGSRVARKVAVSAAVVIALVMVGSTVLADPLHHALESLLGTL